MAPQKIEGVKEPVLKIHNVLPTWPGHDLKKKRVLLGADLRRK
jgi:hypothetical protein